jgi:hypothetical protein
MRNGDCMYASEPIATPPAIIADTIGVHPDFVEVDCACVEASLDRLTFVATLAEICGLREARRAIRAVADMLAIELSNNKNVVEKKKEQSGFLWRLHHIKKNRVSLQSAGTISYLMVLVAHSASSSATD